jgi:endonuclease/exonuclease/phosphatase family metal-dependent hydrolase
VDRKSSVAESQLRAIGARSGLPRRDFLRQLACAPALLSISTSFSSMLESLARAGQPSPPAPIDYTSGPALLTYKEILALQREHPRPEDLQAKLDLLLTTPFVSTRAWQSGQRPLKPESPRLGNFLRVAQWNIDRGLQFDAIRLVLADRDAFSAFINAKNPALSADDIAAIREQADFLRQADVIVLNEVDWGINRTLFRNVCAELAAALNMNYVYGVEFVEVDPITMGLDQSKVIVEVRDAYAGSGDKKQASETFAAVMAPAPDRYLGLHGSAILTRYPPENARLIPFRAQGYDWFAGRSKRTPPQRVESRFVQMFFDEQLFRQMRCGGRMMLAVDLVDPDLPTGRVTLVATHLEDMTSPEHRVRQMQELLDTVGQTDHPVIVAGDMNTTAHDGEDALSAMQAIKRDAGTGSWRYERGFIEAVEKATPLGWALGLTGQLFGMFPKLDDPTKHRVPLVLDNTEAEFFDALERFRFHDGSSFDFRGDPHRSAHGKSGTLANSNERAEKGFVPTYELNRSYGRLASYKLDWIFVRPAQLNSPRAAAQPYRFAPHFGRTLRALNHAIPGRISDHNPITADLPFDEPPRA